MNDEPRISFLDACDNFHLRSASSMVQFHMGHKVEEVWKVWEESLNLWHIEPPKRNVSIDGWMHGWMDR